MSKIIVSLIVFAVTYIGWTALGTEDLKELPKLDQDEWWGPASLKGKQDTTRHFQIKFSDEMIKDLKSRLKNRRPFVPPLEGIGFEYGFNSQMDIGHN